MILYNLPIVLCVLLVMCFQTNFFFNSVFDKSARKTNRIVYFIIYGLLCFMYLVIPMNSYIASCVALLMIFGLAQSYDVEIKTKVIFYPVCGFDDDGQFYLALYFLKSRFHRFHYPGFG